ncbi:unnamed protein product [Paramecium octaurelia]|uniref:Uncharacterized protein n=1 Tax=Paramecium octaurelia TaxID=43137 RepID=A0A8S1UIA0_PAROT|nr:unnamed protein product [Paramecium octaurelia]
MGIINPIHQFEDPNIIKNEAKQKEQEWYAQRMKQKQRPKPEDPLIEPQADTHVESLRINKVMKQEGKERLQSAKVTQQQYFPVQDKQKET